MSLNKTRKRAIAKARRRESRMAKGVIANVTGKQMEEAIHHIGRVARAFFSGMDAFSKAFRESMEQ